MAPALTYDFDSPSEDPIQNHKAPKNIYPDGIRTSGQHPPVYEQLRDYSAFPKKISGPTAWQREDYEGHPEKWTHVFASSEIDELGKAADGFLEKGIAYTGITKETFELPTLGPLLEKVRDRLLNGDGFILFKGFPANEWSIEKTSVGYMGLGTHLGYFVSQNSRGHVLGHVKDVGDDATQIDKVRIYRTSARQFFHVDDSDIVGLLCLHRAKEGGESDLVSSHQVWNVLQEEYPDVAETLTQPNWYFDRKGEKSKGQEEWIRTAVFYLENGGDERLYVKWDPYFVRSLTRFSSIGKIPPLSEAQQRALEILESTCRRLALHMILEVGDIQFLSNAHIFHARSAYVDYPAPHPRRHLLRLWLSVPETEGGWKLPMPDTLEKKRGGVQVDDMPPRLVLDAE